MVTYLKTTFVVFIIFFFLEYTLGEAGCHTSQVSDCVHCLRSIRETLGVYNGTCWCYEDLGAVRECEHFRTKIWSHPCEKRISDFGIQNRLFQLAAEDPQPIRDTLLLTEESTDDIDIFERSSVVKRTTRSPMATEIEQWRQQLSGILPGIRPFKSELSCNSALYDICLKHISCRELWRIFRESCVVDAQNQCRMTNKDNCWQSFEGISWTGLGNCTCVDRNSDCHWIRLQTNYNKCIYELSLSGYKSRQLAEEKKRLEQQRKEDERRRTYEEEARKEDERRRIYEEEARKAEEYRRRVMAMQNNNAQTKSTSTSAATTSEESPILTLSTLEDISTSMEATVAPRASKFFTGAPVDSPMHLELRSEVKHGGSTCQKAHKRCELNETCKWHLSEVQMRCNSDSSCIRNQCASALRRFSRYVNKELSEAVTFCQCLPGDAQCKEHQHLMYPRCMYSQSEKTPKENCLEAIKSCKKESHCNRHLSSFNRSCSITEGGICNSRNLPECRQALLSIRGTPLEMPCYCPEDDRTCLFEQSLMLPSNPCVELGMEDYAKSHPEDHLKPSEKFETDLSVNEPRDESNNDIQSLSSSSTTTTEEPGLEVTLAPELSNSTEYHDEDRKVEDILLQKKKVNVSKIIQEKIQMASNSSQQIVDENYLNKTDGIETTTKPHKRVNLHTYPTDTYVTQTPPPQGGCRARNIEGSWITHYKNSIVRQYNDWSGKCSSWCECSADEKLTCHQLPCLEDVGCKTDQTNLAFGEKLYINNRGACICHSGEFICDTANGFPEELDAGLYISLGFSSRELKMFREKVPKNSRERSGLISPVSSVVKDIVSRLQFALERETLCRIIIVEDLTHDESIVLQLQWFGLDPYTNVTEPQWHIGKMEKICTPYVKELERNFFLEKEDRYQLLLSTVKQLTVFDLLDGLPPLNKASIHSFSIVLIIDLLLGLIRRNDFLFF
ncbi:hypothetical protein FO519_002131 [Halicephalobus sp. NKZ332]|nr:hypothetical protein FO519_002131 [Halicephalobus sp. NKZ332]